MKQTIIGITTCLDTKSKIVKNVDYLYVRREYGKAVKAAGAQPIFLDPSIDPDVAADLCDGIVISGGGDIDAQLYGETTREISTLEPLERTKWELELIKACDSRDVPVLGICYGNQLLNVHYGGTLYQDISEELSSNLDHGSSAKQSMHAITFEVDYLGYKAGQRISSAARHHQAIKDIAPGFRVVARADDGVVEAIEGNGHYGIQWHAESDDTAKHIYGEFISICKNQHAESLLGFLAPEAV